MKYTYKRLSDSRLKEIRKNTNNNHRRELVTEILELRRSVEYWRSLTHVSLGGRRV